MDEDNPWQMIHDVLMGNRPPLPGCTEADVDFSWEKAQPAQPVQEGPFRDVNLWRRDVFGNDHLMDTFGNVDEAKKVCQTYRDSKKLAKQHFYLKWAE